MSLVSIKKLALVMILGAFAISCGKDELVSPRHETLVALYSGRGAADEGMTAAQKMFEWMGYEVTRISPSQINTGGLGGFDLICFPGGDMYCYSQDITAAGKLEIRRFVSGGGGYIGICGGAYFAAHTVYWQGAQLNMTPLALFSGKAIGPIDEIRGYSSYVMCQLDIVAQAHPITTDEDSCMSVLYWGGPYLLPDAGSEAVVICDYHTTGNHAMVAFEYGEGRVFLTGAHPEFEEDSDRDGVALCDTLDDKGSEWPFMKRATRWCLGEASLSKSISP